MTFFSIKLELGNALKNPCDYRYVRVPDYLLFTKEKPISIETEFINIVTADEKVAYKL